MSGGNPKHWTKEEDNLLTEKLASDMPYAQLTKIFNCSEMTVARRAKNLGLASHKSITLKANAQNLNTHYFDNLTPNVAYDLGYIWADGCVYWGNKFGLKLKCTTEDESIILGIRNRLSSLHAIARHPGKRRKDGGWDNPSTSIQIYGKWVRILIDQYGIVPNKTCLDCEFPQVPDEFFGHFVRGFFDGDGSICRHMPKGRKFPKYLASFIGSPRFINGLAERLIDFGIKLPYLSARKRKKVHQLTALWSAQNNVYKLGQLMYPVGEYPFLARKRALFQRFVEECPYASEESVNIHRRRSKG